MKACFKLLILLFPLLSACGSGMPFGPHSGSSSSASSVNLADAVAVKNEALTILANNCVLCHSVSSGPAGVYNLLDTNHLISSGLVVPGNPDGSKLLQSIEANRMPAAGPLSANDKTITQSPKREKCHQGLIPS